MLKQTNIALKIGLVSAIAASSWPVVPVQAQENSSKLRSRSRPALNQLESRSFAKNPEAFFPNPSGQDALVYPEGTVGRRSSAESEFKMIGQEFQVKLGETTHADPEFDTFSRNEAQTDKIRVLINLVEWNN
jgi:hypothetical protein